MQTIENHKPVQIAKDEVYSALYGLLRLIAGYGEWQKVNGCEEHERTRCLIDKTLQDITSANQHPETVDSKTLTSLTRKLKAYHQLLLLENFCFKEVDWED